MCLFAALTSARAAAQAPGRPYALPFQARPAIAPNVVRVEGTLGVRDESLTALAMTTVGARIAADVSLLARAAYVVDVPSGAGAQGALANPVLGVLYTPEISPGLRLALFAGAALPLGQGEGLPGTSREVVALSQARITRASMDNAMFATSHATVAVGMAVLWLVERFTLQLEATLLGGFRARTSQPADAAVENLTAIAWVAYTPIDALSLGVALQHQRFLSTPAPVRALGEIARSQTSASLALRARARAAEMWWNPGISYTHGLDGLLWERGDHVITADLLVQY